MKQSFGVILFMICTFCQSQEKNISDENKCSVTSVPSEVLQWQYIDFMEGSAFYKGEFANFKKVKNGVLLYKWQEGIGTRRFLVVDFDENFKALIKTDKVTEIVNFTHEEKKKLKFITEVLEKKSYYQNCVKDHGHATYHVLVVRSNNEMKVQYFSPWNHPYEIKMADANINSIQEIFRIMDRKFYKDLIWNKKNKTPKS